MATSSTWLGQASARRGGPSLFCLLDFIRIPPCYSQSSLHYLLLSHALWSTTVWSFLGSLSLGVSTGWSLQKGPYQLGCVSRPDQCSKRTRPTTGNHRVASDSHSSAQARSGTLVLGHGQISIGGSRLGRRRVRATVNNGRPQGRPPSATNPQPHCRPSRLNAA